MSLTPAEYIAQCLPGDDDYERGFRDALESVVLALDHQMFREMDDEAIMTVLETVMDAYGNNVE